MKKPPPQPAPVVVPPWCVGCPLWLYPCEDNAQCPKYFPIVPKGDDGPKK